ncbi:hypothetical protein AB0G71_01005 [Streptomyces sp. NPDC020403]|uniref:hypothetical protein n=1 Tax=unclassified Streptomyces TaxID=2593676 RepID=UPI0033FE0B3C
MGPARRRPRGACASQPDLLDAITAAGLPATPVGPPLAQDESVGELRRRQERAAERLTEPPDAQELMRMAEDRPERLTPDFLDGLFTVMTSASSRTSRTRRPWTTWSRCPVDGGPTWSSGTRS